MGILNVAGSHIKPIPTIINHFKMKNKLSELKIISIIKNCSMSSFYVVLILISYMCIVPLCKVCIGCEDDIKLINTCLAILSIVLLCGSVKLYHFIKEDLKSEISVANIFTIALLFALLTEIASPLAWTSIQMMFFPISFITITFALTFLLMGRWAMFIWGPYLFITFLFRYLNEFYGLKVTPSVIMQFIGASPQDVQRFISAWDIVFAIAFLGICCGVVYLLTWRFRICHKLYMACLLALMGASLTCAAVAHPVVSSFLSEYRVDAPSLIYQLPQSYRLAMANKNKVTRILAKLPSPAASPTSIFTLNGNEGVVCILHIGESLRSDRLGLNGYHRETTPWLSNNSYIISFPNCTASAPFTQQAFPVILTNARANFQNDISKELMPTCGSVIDLFKANHFNCYAFIIDMQLDPNATWNAVFEAALVPLISSCDKIYEHSSQETSGPKDQLIQIKNVLAKDKGNCFFLINNYGSHAPYIAYDESVAKFKPSNGRPISKNPTKNPKARELLNNAYDNTILQTDEYIKELFKSLEGRPFIYIYVGDHGEPLGEFGEWGRSEVHFFEAKWSCVPFIVGYSPEFEELHPHFQEAINQMKSNRNIPIAHENVFHTLIGIMGIESKYYDSTHDASSSHLQRYQGPHFSRSGKALDTHSWE